MKILAKFMYELMYLVPIRKLEDLIQSTLDGRVKIPDDIMLKKSEELANLLIGSKSFNDPVILMAGRAFSQTMNTVEGERVESKEIDEHSKRIREGTVRKGGVNSPPQSQQPSPGVGATRPALSKKSFEGERLNLDQIKKLFPTETIQEVVAVLQNEIECEIEKEYPDKKLYDADGGEVSITQVVDRQAEISQIDDQIKQTVIELNALSEINQRNATEETKTKYIATRQLFDTLQQKKREVEEKCK